MRMRLDRWLTTLGICSRSEGKEWIRSGAVRVNGTAARDPAQTVETERDTLQIRDRTVDGRILRHVMLHKPAGVLTAARDRKQPTVMDLLPPEYASMGCMPVGRLDRDTTGILILTCDGTLNHRLLAPGRHVDKVYLARVTGKLTEEDVRAFARGLELSDFTALPAKLEIQEEGKGLEQPVLSGLSKEPENGFPARPAFPEKEMESGRSGRPELPDAAEGTSLARVTVQEGKYHQVKRMFAATGHEVLTLHRRSFGPLTLDPALPEGGWRELKPEELEALYAAAGMEPGDEDREG